MFKKWQFYLVATLLLATLLGVFVYLNRQLKNKQKLITSNQWPLEAFGQEEFYSMHCDFEQIHKHSYNQAPVQAGNWRSLVDISCLYLNATNQLETIYLPFWVYQSGTKGRLKVGARCRSCMVP